MLFIYIILIIVAIIAILGFIAPKDFKVERSIVVDADQEKVFNSLKSLKEQENWSVWATRDPEMKSEYKGTDGEVGSVHFWEGNKQVGSGEQELKAFEPNSYIETELRFLKPFKATNLGFFKIQPSNGSTEVTWGFSGSSPFPMNIMMMFMNIDKSVGKDFEEGLANFKEYVER